MSVSPRSCYVVINPSFAVAFFPHLWQTEIKKTAYEKREMFMTHIFSHAQHVKTCIISTVYRILQYTVWHFKLKKHKTQNFVVLELLHGCGTLQKAQTSRRICFVSFFVAVEYSVNSALKCPLNYTCMLYSSK